MSAETKMIELAEHRKPDTKREEDKKLDEALDESFPASDPPAPAHPDVTGWDVDEKPEPRRK